MLKKIIFVSHCIMNTASKVVRSEGKNKNGEEKLRKEILCYAIEHDIQIIQLPCPEFTAYGAKRWGHTREQFDNPFFRNHCRRILAPVVEEMEAYLQEGTRRFQVLGIVGVNGSPSCGIDFSCSGPWGGEFSGRTDLKETLASVGIVSKKGILMEVLSEMLEERRIELKMAGLDARNPQPLYQLLEDE